MNQFKSIQTQILLSFLTVLVAVQCVLFYSLLQSNTKEKDERAQIHLTTARAVFENQFSQRTQNLTAFAQTVAKDFGLKQALKEDTRSFLIALNNHRQRLTADLAIAIDSNGEFIGKLIYDKRSNQTSADTDPSSLSLKTDVLPDENRPILYEYKGVVYQLALVPVQSGAQTVAWIGFGFAVDTDLAERLSILAGMSVDIGYQKGGQWLLLASSVEDRTNGQELEIKPRSSDSHFIATSVTVGFNDGKELVVSLYLCIFPEKICSLGCRIVGYKLF
ncbi:cache domain-containing protein [Vibrio aquimaris]|uniref:Double Cache domain-containing protein n=1 Tax=Vibrio aquimaris TaxID=2587862 RepID=A0A5P9CKI1_9VIBR|nr:cache domain-containing protein [Vibrio aquimaris]QFT26521.1 hypothetical protein FIV01_08775 [Vibrio aquimaris]